MTCLWLFLEFFKVGLFSVGGGLASLPLLYEIAEKYGWFTVSQVADMVAVAESTPGPIAVNMATFAGYQAAGIIGGIIATVALCLPEIIIGFLVCRVLARFSDSRVVQDIFGGLRPAVAGLLLAVALSMVSLALWQEPMPDFAALPDWRILVLLALMIPAVFIWKKHPIVYIAAGAVIGILFRL